MRNVRVDPELGCWLWTGRLSVSPRSSGYAVCTYDKKKWYVHRLSYVLTVGEIPIGMELDHLCRVRHCVNPAHLEPVTRQVNLLRGDTFAAKNAAKTHCPKGHPYDSVNTYRSKIGRVCRRCHADAEARRRGRSQVG